MQLSTAARYSFCIIISLSGLGAKVYCQDKPGNDAYPLLSHQTMAGLRSISSSAGNQTFLITDPDKQGIFASRPDDKTSSDDSTMTIVSANGIRFKRVIETGILNARWFGASGDGAKDDWPALQKAIDYIISNPYTGRTLYLPPGTYRISNPLIIGRLNGSSYRQVSINITGPANSKSLASGWAKIAPTFSNTFAIGIQLGKGVLIKDLQIVGKFSLPDKLTPLQIDTLPAAAWTDHIARDNSTSPYCGIVIDPFCDSSSFIDHAGMYPGLHQWYPSGVSRGGSSSIQITGCSIHNFIVGVMLTPSNQQNADMIDVIDCDISSNKVGYAMGQAQSKECHVERLKCWGPTHTLFDNVTYGFHHGDGSNIPMVDGANIASHVKQLCRIYASSFSGTFRNIYAEGLFRIGVAGGGATVSFEDCQFNFSTIHPADPYPDFYILGSGASFHGCMLRQYSGHTGLRLVLSGTNNCYQGGLMNEPPVAVNLDESGILPSPVFSNVAMYYTGGTLGSGNPGTISSTMPFLGLNGTKPDPVYFNNTYHFRNHDYGRDVLYRVTYKDSYERTAKLSGSQALHIDRSSGSAYFELSRASDTSLLRIDDILLTTGLHYQDQFSEITASTYPIGFISAIGHDTVYLRNIAVGIHNGMSLSVWVDYYVNQNGPFTGNIKSSSNTITDVQGVFPAVGERPDIPMVPIGTFVTAVNRSNATVTLSNVNIQSQSFYHYTFMNGYPLIEMFSAYDFKTLLESHKTFIGNADFFHLTAGEGVLNFSHTQTGTIDAHYRIMNTNFGGDTSLHPFKYVPVFNMPVNK
jgi:hypothetical protein